jgi:hypothetical protein
LHNFRTAGPNKRPNSRITCKINKGTPNELVAGLADLECYYFRLAALGGNARDQNSAPFGPRKTLFRVHRSRLSFRLPRRSAGVMSAHRCSVSTSFSHGLPPPGRDPGAQAVAGRENPNQRSVMGLKILVSYAPILDGHIRRQERSAIAFRQMRYRRPRSRQSATRLPPAADCPAGYREAGVHLGLAEAGATVVVTARTRAGGDSEWRGSLDETVEAINTAGGLFIMRAASRHETHVVCHF